MSSHDLRCVLRSDNKVGESPAWRAADQALYWVDIERCLVNWFHPESGDHRTWLVPSMPGCLVFREGSGAIVPARDGIYDLDFDTGRTTRIMDPPYDPEVYRFNDGKCDRQGRLWVGTMPVDLTQLGTQRGRFYRYDGTSITAQFDIDIANGLAFTADGLRAYRAESKQRIIYAYDMDPVAGALSNERVFATIPEGYGFPDGATVDTEGGYWCALPAGKPSGAIARFKPNGELDFRLETTIPCPIMINFGGPDMSTLYVTSGQFERFVDHPGAELSGSLFAVQTDFQGVPEPLFAPARP